MDEKKISEMTNEEILRQQLRLLAERSRCCEDCFIAKITNSMIAVFDALKISDFVPEDSSGKHLKSTMKCNVLN